MFKIAYCAGHYINTPGKRLPKELDIDETREWVLNDRVADAFAEAAQPCFSCMLSYSVVSSSLQPYGR